MGYDIRTVEKAMGTVNYGSTEEEKGNVVFRRSVFAVKDIAAGEIFTEDNIRIIRPGYGVKPKYYKDILGKMAAEKINRGMPLQPDMICK